MQKKSSNYEQGDIIIADVLYSQQVGIKRRPVLIISNSNYNKTSDDVITARISSTKPKSKYELKLKKEDLIYGELHKESKIIIDFITTIDKRIASPKIGKISSEKIKEVKEKLKELYSIS